MKEIEFVKRFGWGDAREYLDGAKFWEIDRTPIIIDTVELKRIIESHDYIESLGGYQFVKDNLPFGYFGDGDYKDLIQKCLEGVESCK